MNRRYLSTALAITLVLAAFATTLSQPSAAKHGSDRLELSLTDLMTVRFTLYDDARVGVASGVIVDDAEHASRTFTVSDSNGELARITRQASDRDRLRVTVATKTVTTDFNFEVKQLDSLYQSLSADRNPARLEAEQQRTLAAVGQLRQATRAAIGPDLHDRLVSAISQDQSGSVEAETLAAVLGSRRVAATDSGRPPSCVDMAIFFYHGCIRNGHSEGECILYALEELWDCITWQPEQL